MHKKRLTEKEYISLLTTLLLQEGIGHAHLRRIVPSDFDIGSMPTLQQFRKLLVNSIESINRIKNIPAIEDLYARSQKDALLHRSEGVSITPIWSSAYPARFKRLSDPPILIFTRGRLDLLNAKRSVGIIGTRRNSIYGARATRTVVKWLSQLGSPPLIVSGLAYGIDEFAHRNALVHGVDTVAITAGGLDKGFPRKNLELFHEICEKGLLLAEFPPSVPVIKGMFPMRNRLLAGLIDLLIVIESGISGGSMITVKQAAEIGVEVMALPGDIDRDVAAGCNQLIMDGVIPLTNADAIKHFFDDMRLS